MSQVGDKPILTIAGPAKYSITIHSPEGACELTPGDLLLADGTSVQQIANTVRAREVEHEVAKRGAVAVALTGAGLMADKNPVVSRRFWGSLGRG